VNPQNAYDSQPSVLPTADVTLAEPRRLPGLHRALAHIDFPPSRWLHVTLLPALLCAGLVWASDALLRLWAAAINWGIVALDLNGIVATQPLSWANLRDGRLLVADVPAAPPSSEQLLVGALVATALWLLSMVIRAERTPLRYLLRAFLLCEAASLVFFGLLDGVLPYTLGDHIAPGILMAWIFMLLYIGEQIFMSLMDARGSGGVAWFAHIGGFAAGYFLVRVLPVTRRWKPLLRRREPNPFA